MDTHPNYLKKSNIPLTIVCGPPCSGKTTYVKSMAHKGDVVIDLDAIQKKLNPAFRVWTEIINTKLLHRAIGYRNLLLAGLAKRSSGCAWFIVGAPTQRERTWWQHKLGGEVVLLNPGAEECKRRAYARGTPLAAHGASTWYAKAEDNYWVVPTHKRPIRMDGWFADEDSDEVDVVLAHALAP